jgi:hypothetical protein
MKKQFVTLQALATAVAAYNHNGRLVIRDTRLDQDGREIQPNRQLISDCLLCKNSALRVNDHYLKEAEGIIIYLQQTVIMQSLKGKTDQFLGQISELLSNQDINESKLGLLAWAPKLADDYQKKDHVREISARYEYLSQYIGRVGDKIEIDFTMIDKRYIQNMDCYAVYGFSNNNLVFYWAKNLDKICEVGRIQGRVKTHKEDEYRNNARVTYLNYVKVL